MKRLNFAKSMKKIIALSLVCLSTVAVFAQGNFRLGLQASPNFAWIKSDIADANNKVGLKFNYGLITEFKISDNYLFSSGIGHAYDGGKLTAALKDTSEALEVNYAAQFINIPLLLKMRTKEIGYMRYFALFGLTTGIKVGEKVSIDKGQDLVDPSISYVNLFKASLTIGLGAEYNLGGSTNLIGGLTFNNNFTNMLDKDDSLLETSASKNFFNSVAVTIGVIF